MNGTPSLRRAVLVLLALVALLATAGCVNLPANTTVTVVQNSAKGGSGADVRVWPQAPLREEGADQIVEGFLQTAASDPSNFPIAQAYLTGEALTNWHQNRVVVFSDVSSPTLLSNDSGHVRVQITGTMVATVSENGTYQQIQDPSKDQPYIFSLTLDKDKGYYRIDRLPTNFGILLTQEAFRADYAAYYLYFLNQDKPDSSMIPVPDYQRSQTGDAATAQNLLGALTAGPPDALTGVATLAAPNIVPAGQVTISPDNTASVPIKSPNDCLTKGKSTCHLLADELLATFSSLASVSNVALVDPQGHPLALSSPVDSLASRYHIAAGAAKGTSFYYLDAKTDLVSRYESANASANPTSVDQVGPDNRKYSQVAVGFDSPQTYAAVVDDKGSKLYVGTPGSAKDSAPIYTAAAGHRIRSLTWDAFGRLWFLDSMGTTTSLYRVVVSGELKPLLQQVTIVGDSGTVVTGIAAAPDGQRIAVSYTSGSAAWVVIAVVTATDAGLEANLSLGMIQPVVDHWNSVSDVSWHGSQALAVLGSASPSSPVTVSELNSDGSPVVNAADLTPVTFNPPTGTYGIEWSGTALLAATHSGSGASATWQIEQYSFTAGTWTVATTNGFSPTYMN